MGGRSPLLRLKDLRRGGAVVGGPAPRLHGRQPTRRALLVRLSILQRWGLGPQPEGHSAVRGRSRAVKGGQGQPRVAKGGQRAVKGSQGWPRAVNGRSRAVNGGQGP
jgi:hypothetical protein